MTALAMAMAGCLAFGQPTGETCEAGAKHSGLEVAPDVVVLPGGDGLEVRTEAVKGAVGNYRRTIVSIRNKSGTPVQIDDIGFFRDWAPGGIRDGYRSGNTDGSVAIFPAKRMFAGVEHPMAKLEVEDGAVTAHLPRNMALAPGEAWRFSYVVGRYEGTNPRRSFQEYLEAERAHPYRVMPHYNSWFDLNINRNDLPWEKRMDEAEALGVMKAFRAEMNRRGVFIASYLWDDGWDEWNSLWDFHPGFPNGFAKLAEEAHRDKGASIGCWMSPCGGYGQSLKARIAYSRSKGYIGENDGVLRMSNPTYYAAFRDRVLDMIARYDMNLFKFDRMGNGRSDNVGCDTEYAPEFDAVVRLIGEMRRAKPDVFVNCTVGTWASPFWVMFADSIWRGGRDFGRAGTGTDRQKWITYRDKRIHDRFVAPCPLFPLNSMMMHGIIVSKSGAPGCMDVSDTPQSTQDFSDEVWMGVGCGTGLQEYYITPDLMHPRWWDILADGVKWIKANERVLRDVHWIGGDPVGDAGGEIYGYASAGAGKGVVTLRNPSDRPLAFSAPLAEVLDLPEAEKGAEVRHQRTVYAHDAEIGKVARASDALSVRLAPHAMAVMEFMFGRVVTDLSGAYAVRHGRRVFVHEANYDKSKIAPYTLEDPLVFADGRKVATSDDWQVRRREILDVFAHEMFGIEPPAPEALVTELADEKRTADGHAIRRQYRMWFKADKSGPCINWIVWMPAHAKDPSPVILFLNFGGNHELVPDADIPVQQGWHKRSRQTPDCKSTEATRGAFQNPDSRNVFPIGTILANGYAVMSACYCEVSPDPYRYEKAPYTQNPFAYTGVFELWGPRSEGRGDDITSLGAWGWALSRGLDLAERIPELDAKRIVVTGYSRLGKAALIAGARDERFRVVAPIQTGGGGCPLLKRDYGENTSTLNRDFTHWFCENFVKYAEEPWRTMPFDMHLFLACVAPRALLVMGFDDRWYDTEGEFLAVKAASPVWRFLGKDALPDVPWPEDYDLSAIGRDLGYVRRNRTHGMSAYEWKWLMDFAGKVFQADGQKIPHGLPTPISLDGEWEMAYSSNAWDLAEMPTFKGVRVEKAIPGFWENMVPQLRAAGMTDEFRGNSKWVKQTLPIQGQAADLTIPGIEGCFFYRRQIRLDSPESASLAFDCVRNSVAVWVNGVFAGRHDGFSVPFEIPIPEGVLAAGDNEIVLAVSNKANIGYNGQAVSGLTTRALFAATGGIDGRVELRFAANGIADAYVTTAADLKTWTAHVPGGVPFRYEILDGDRVVAKGEAAGDFTVSSDGLEFWSPENPKRYELVLKTAGGEYRQKFGIRRLAVDGERLRLNGEFVYLRGVTEHCYFPQTVHPPRDIEYYRTVTAKRRELGFNFVRFHTWVPPEEYLEAMDELGMLVHIESPNFVTLEEYAAIVRFARRHPCVVIYCTGNETWIDARAEEYLKSVAGIVHGETDALFTPMSAMRGVEYMLGRDKSVLADKPFPHNPGKMARLAEFCDFWTSYQRGDASYRSLNGRSAATVDACGDAYCGKPRLSHEICIDGSYMDLSLENDYPEGSPIVASGLFSEVRRQLESKVLLSRAGAYARNSAEWMRRIRKFTFEKMRSMKRTSGFDFLGDINTHWHTFGYSVGMMDEFYRLKPGETAENVRRYNSAAVLLTDLGGDFNVAAGEKKRVAFSISNFAGDVDTGTLRVELVEVSRAEAQSRRDGVWSVAKVVGVVRNGEIAALGEFDIEFPAADAPEKYLLRASFTGGAVTAENEWELYAFPSPTPLCASAPSAPLCDNVRIVNDISRDELLLAMERGERVLLLGKGPFKGVKTSYRIGLAGRCGGNYATVLKENHPALDAFPHEGFCGWQFRRLMEGAYAVQLEADVPFDPIIDIASSDKFAIRQALLFEYKVGEGRLLVCPLNFPGDDPAAAWLKARLEAYAASDAFAPEQTLATAQLASVIDAPLLDGGRNTNNAFNANDPANAKTTQGKNRCPCD